MKEYIERGSALNALCSYCSLYEEGQPCGCAEREELLAVPVADVEEVRHGKWVKPTMFSESSCSVCGKCPKLLFGLLPPYCPNCGAKMDEERIEK